MPCDDTSPTNLERSAAASCRTYVSGSCEPVCAHDACNFHYVSNFRSGTDGGGVSDSIGYIPRVRGLHCHCSHLPGPGLTVAAGAVGCSGCVISETPTIENRALRSRYARSDSRTAWFSV